MPPRALFLAGPESAAGTYRLKYLESILGDKLCCPELHVRTTLIVQISVCSVVLLALAAASGILGMTEQWLASAILSCVSVVFCLLLYFFAGRVIGAITLRQATKIAQQAYDEFRPNIIIAASFGAVVLFNMNLALHPLLLFSPAQDAYHRYIGSKKYPSIQQFPYVLIVHGNADTSVPLGHSIRLVESADLGKCRLEVIEDDHSFHSLTENDYRDMIKEVYNSGKKSDAVRDSSPQALSDSESA